MGKWPRIVALALVSIGSVGSPLLAACPVPETRQAEGSQIAFQGPEFPIDNIGEGPKNLASDLLLKLTTAAIVAGSRYPSGAFPDGVARSSARYGKDRQARLDHAVLEKYLPFRESLSSP